MWFAFQFNDFQVNPLEYCLHLVAGVHTQRRWPDHINHFILYFSLNSPKSQRISHFRRCIASEQEKNKRWNSCIKQSADTQIQTASQSKSSTCDLVWIGIYCKCVFFARFFGCRNSICTTWTQNSIEGELEPETWNEQWSWFSVSINKINSSVMLMHRNWINTMWRITITIIISWRNFN